MDGRSVSVRFCFNANSFFALQKKQSDDPEPSDCFFMYQVSTLHLPIGIHSFHYFRIFLFHSLTFDLQRWR